MGVCVLFGLFLLLLLEMFNAFFLEIFYYARVGTVFQVCSFLFHLPEHRRECFVGCFSIFVIVVGSVEHFICLRFEFVLYLMYVFFPFLPSFYRYRYTIVIKYLL